MTVVDLGSPRDLASLLPSASVEISSRGPQLQDLQLQDLRDHFAPGRDVTITFLPGDNYRHNIETAAALRRAGFNPVPHIAAREMPSREALNDFLARGRGEADVSRVLLIAGDVAIARGPFRSSREIGASGLLEAHGITAVSVAGHPEGHPFLDAAHMVAQLAAWRDWARTTGVAVSIVTQFCFESAPILGLLGDLGACGIALPVFVGLAGPASPATLGKFALRCGIGNSIRALRAQIGRYGRLLADTGPDEVLRGLRSAPQESTAAVAGFHLFPFGGVRKSGLWLRSAIEDARREEETSSRALSQNP
jgi:methylenetetrahydrofolate reductase (NADH)